jgi:hypothetical protein
VTLLLEEWSNRLDIGSRESLDNLKFIKVAVCQYHCLATGVVDVGGKAD